MSNILVNFSSNQPEQNTNKKNHQRMSDTDVLGLQGKIKQDLCEQDRRNAIRNSFANEFTWSREIENCMQTHFNFKSYIGKQQEGINATLCGRDVLVNTHTSSGKSLIYVVPGIIERGVTVVLFPTIALMESQMVNLRDFGITDIACLNNNTTAEARVGIYQNVRSQTVRYFFMTPEMFIMNSEVEQELTVLYRRNQLCRIVIDEAHLIDEYRNFREAYVEMGKFIKKFKTVPVLALTATATPDVVKKIQTSLLFEKGHVYITSEDFDRSNLHYQVIRCDSVRY
jgi:bloom syndrome protein